METALFATEEVTATREKGKSKMEIKLSGKSHEQRIADRLKGSNDTSTADTIVTHGTGPTRVVHSIHHSRNQQHGPVDHGGPDIAGGKR
jgi:hypothetical protein